MLSFSFQIYFQRQETQQKGKHKRSKLFGPHSKPILACFGHRPIHLIRSIRLDSGRIGLVQLEFVKKKKKTLDAASTRGQPRRWPHLILDSGVAPSQLRQCFLEQITIDIQF